MQSELQGPAKGTWYHVHLRHAQPLSEAFAMANKVVIMKDGKVEQIGSPQEVYRSPQSRFVAEFAIRDNLLSGKVVGCRPR